MKLDPVKLAHLARGIDGMSERLDYWLSERLPAPAVMRRADKAWDESKHPRGPDGKFIEGEGAAAASAAEYLSQQQKAGKKPTPNGMMQHLLMNGGITKNEIWDTTKANSVFRIDKVEQKVTGSGKAQHLVHVTYMGTKEDG